jgi:uncharacterized Zn finger protein
MKKNPIKARCPKCSSNSIRVLRTPKNLILEATNIISWSIIGVEVNEVYVSCNNCGRVYKG